MAFTQTNVRLIAGYSSVAQLGFITAGIFALRADGSDGAVLQMVNHGLVVAPIFVIVAILLERSGSEDIREMGGMAMRAPVLAALFLIVTLATLAMPGSANFVGEFYILNSLFDAKIVFAIVAASGIAMSAYYALRLYQRTMHNRKPDGILSREISLRDGVVLVPLVLCILGLALYPQLILKRTEASASHAVAAACSPIFVPGPGGFRIEVSDNCPGGNDARTYEGLEVQRISSAPNNEGWTGYAPLASAGEGP
jgi:NADH-quinone oxidoreductase subunit M